MSFRDSSSFQRGKVRFPFHLRQRKPRPLGHAGRRDPLCAGKTPFLTSLAAGLTLETCVVLPVFVVCMLAVIHLGNVMNAATRLDDALTQTAQEMAVGAYVSEYGEGDDVLNVVLSAAWAHGRTMAKAGDIRSVRNANLLLSSFRSSQELIDLVLTWQMDLPVGMIRAPDIFWVQRSAVRAWTGREGSGAPKEEEGGEEHDHHTVYVAENGRVYHTDPNCTHIHLSIMPVPFSAVPTRRNVGGGKYHACEHCGGGHGGTVYITMDGIRYHSSLSCPGLKRTIREVDIEEVGDLPVCSRCGGRH